MVGHRAEYVLLVPTMMNRIHKLPDAVRDSYEPSTVAVVLHLGANGNPSAT